jgi:hypothetical protein
VHPLGCDDRDRPGALAFHALFIGRWAYRRAGADPYVFAEATRGHWCPADQDRDLPAGRHTIRHDNWNSTSPSPVATLYDRRLTSIVTALTQGRRVVVQSSAPIDTLARIVWHALPRHVRRRASTATWAFDNANQFDLVALPRLPTISLNASDLVLAGETADH